MELLYFFFSLMVVLTANGQFLDYENIAFSERYTAQR